MSEDVFSDESLIFSNQKSLCVKKITELFYESGAHITPGSPKTLFLFGFIQGKIFFNEFNSLRIFNIPYVYVDLELCAHLHLRSIFVHYCYKIYV